ncbi:ALP1-like protein [Tanacetum coccineum]
MNSKNLFFDDTDDEAEVNSLVFNFLKDAALVIQASTPTIPKNQRNHIVRDCYGAHDRLVKAYFAKEQFYNDYLFRHDVVGKAGISALVKKSTRCSLDEYSLNDLWIWHAFFSVAGSNNDVNVLRQSTVLNDLKLGKAPEVPFVANDVNYKWGYYLTDGIYLEWVVHMKSISQPGSNDVKRIRYKQAHEVARKDVERAFGVLKKKWAIVRTSAQSRSLKKIMHLMYTCIILHNMIRKEKGKAISPDFYPEEQHREDDPVRSAQDRLRVIREIHDEETHLSLKADIVEHIWHRTNAH